MEAIGAIASTLQIAGYCAEITMTIVQWYKSVRTVDERIERFKHGIYTLQTTYETLTICFTDKSKMKIANATNKDAGGRLVRQLETTLRECDKTVLAISNELGRIHSTSNAVFRPLLKQLRESLAQGDLARLQARIAVLNSELHLVMQMISVTMALKQDITPSNQAGLLREMAELRESVNSLSRQLARPQRTFSFGQSTLLPDDDDLSSKIYDTKTTQGYVDSANKFIETASAAVTARSVGSTVTSDLDSPAAQDGRRGSLWAPLTDYQLSTIDSFVERLPSYDTTPAAFEGSIEPRSQPEPEQDEAHVPEVDFAEDEIEITLVNTLLSTGQSEIDGENYASAEENFREAHQKLNEMHIGSQIISSMSDVTLSLAFCCVKQDKYDEAIDLLKPLCEALWPTSGEAGAVQSPVQLKHLPDQAESLSACHMLGEVYLKKSDFKNAELYSVRAFKERSKLLHLEHPKTQASVQLVISMYSTAGRDAMANAHKNFLRSPLVPTDSLSASRPRIASRSSTSDQSVTTPEAASPKPRRTGFHLPKMMRSDKATSPKPMQSFAKPLQHARSPVIADLASDYSTSPHDASYMGGHFGQRPSAAHTRTESLTSYPDLTQPQRWPTTNESISSGFAHNRQPSVIKRSMTESSTTSLPAAEPTMNAIRDLSLSGSTRDAVKSALSLLKQYDTDNRILIQRENELKRNVEKSKGKGLAGTGHGYAPIHFFCSLGRETPTEVEVLIRQAVNVNAVAHKASMPGVGAFTPLSIAVEKGRAATVSLLLEARAYIYGPELRACREALHPLFVACRKGYVDITHMLLDHGGRLTAPEFPRTAWHGNSLLHEAAYRCDIPMVKSLVERQRRDDADSSVHSYTHIGRASQRDAFGMTPIMYAVDMRDAHDPELRAHKLSNRTECLRLLLERARTTSTLPPRSEFSVEGDGDSDAVVVDRLDDICMSNHGDEESPERMTTDIHIEDERGRSVFWYAGQEKEGSKELIAFLDGYARRTRLIDFEE